MPDTSPSSVPAAAARDIPPTFEEATQQEIIGVFRLYFNVLTDFEAVARAAYRFGDRVFTELEFQAIKDGRSTLKKHPFVEAAYRAILGTPS